MRATAFVFLAVVLAACATVPARSGDTDRRVTEDAAPTNDRLYVTRPEGLSIVSVATGKVERELPPGILAADRSAYWTVERAGPTTVVRKLDPASGLELARIGVPGAFDLPRAYGPLGDAISASGRYLALVDAAGASAFVVLDLRSGTEKARSSLPGSFTFDALDEYGTSLYLLEHPQAGTDKYNVRLYDLTLGTLDPKAVTDAKSAQPTAADLARGTMGGVYHASASAGLWHFGLYTSTSKGPTIHALNMTARYAFCLFTLNDAATHSAAWAIVPSPKGDRVFAVNAATGRLASITSDTLEVASRTFSVQMPAEPVLRGAAAITADASRIYASGGNGILVVDAHTLSMKAQYLSDRRFSSVMVSSDGTRLYALAPGGTISRIEPSSGRDLGVVARLPSAVSIVRVD